MSYHKLCSIHMLQSGNKPRGNYMLQTIIGTDDVDHDNKKNNYQCIIYVSVL